MEHKLVTEEAFISGKDAECSCSDPDWEGGWSGIVGIYNATDQEIEDWYHDHLVEVGVL